MPEPLHSTAVGVAVGAGIGVSGSVFGADAQALLVGLVAAVLISFWLPTIDDRKKAAAGVALSSLFAGYGAPWGSTVLADRFHVAGGPPLVLLLALVLGVACPTLVPVALGWAKRKGEAA